MKRNVLCSAVTLLLTVCVVVGGCQSRQESSEDTAASTAQDSVESPAPEESSDILPESEPEPDSFEDESSEVEPAIPEGYVYSQYTGLPVPEEIAGRKAVAISINNHRKASPQSGLVYADIIYEAPVEGNMTRFVAVFQDYEQVEKIGPVRSARRYFIDFALDQSAVLIHFGEDTSISKVYDQVGCPHINGISSLEEVMTWRSKDRKAPHNVYTSGERLLNAMEKAKITADLESEIEPVFSFRKEEETPSGGDPVQHVAIPYLVYKDYNQTAEFFYEAETKSYGRVQFDEPQTDLETGEQLKFKNVLIQIADVHERGDEAGHKDMVSIGEGQGYYLTNGICQPVTWKKADQQSPTHWYDEDGEELLLNPGKTWINVVSLSQKITLE